MRAVFKKFLSIITHAQVLVVILAFTLMVFFSYNFMSGIERKNLIKDADNVILNAQTIIEADLLESEITLGVTAENIRNMILNGSDPDDIHEYIKHTTAYLTVDKHLNSKAIDLYGFFYVFDGIYLSGINRIRPGDNEPHTYSWYNAAVEAAGEIRYTEPYVDAFTGKVATTFFRGIYSNDGSLLGFVCLDVTLDRIWDTVVSKKITEDSYGILMDRNFNVTAHPNPAYIGVHLSKMNDGEAILEELEKTSVIMERKATDYRGNPSVLFVRILNNGWYLAIIEYTKSYYQSVNDIGLILIILGIIFAAALSVILLSMVSAKKKAEERTRLMLDTVPLCADFWDKNFNIIDCNQEAINLFDLSSKNEYLKRFHELSPEYQPDGTLSAQRSNEELKKAFDEGYTRFDWMHKKLNGELIPSEITLIRVKYRNEDIVCGYIRDLRDINTIMEKMREADERAMIMLDAAPIGVTMWDENINLVDFNYEAARVVGIHSKEEYRQRFAETTPEFQADGRKSVDVLMEFLTTAIKKGSNHTIWNHKSVDGEVIPFDAQAVRLVLREDPVVVVYCHDLRELNVAIDKMREADECRQAIFDTTPLGSFMIDNSFKVLECNQEILRLFELSDKKEYLENFFEFSPEYQLDGKMSRGKLVEIINNTFKDGYYRFDWLFRKLNGELIPCEMTLVRVMFRNEEVVCGYIRDLRELRSMMAKIREADECAQVLFDNTPLSCFMLDKNLKLIECNQEIVKMFGLTDKKEFIDQMFDFYPKYQPSGIESGEQIYKYIDEAFEEGFCRFEFMHQKLDGEQIPTEVSLVRVKFKGEYAVAGYVRDLREIKVMFAEMRRAEIAEESSKAKSEFLAKMSHEIRTPMNAILGITEIQLQDSALPLVTKEALERIYNSGDLLLGIINDILDLSKIEAGKLELMPVQYDIASLIHDTVKLNIMRYESKPIDFKLTVSENVPSALLGDELRIKQILNNLLSNAFKYTQEGQVELMLSADKKKGSTAVVLIIRVSDTGQGMTSEQVKKLGDKFSRFNMEANRKTEGTGLGMNITRNLINMMNGDIYIESTPGMGSVFTVNLPQKCINSDPIGRDLAENLMKLNLKNTTKMRNAQITQEFMPYGRVLVVDDVETNLYVARGLLAPYGISIDTAISGFEAIDKIRDGASYDIIFMDHMMPRMDGIEASKIIRSLGYSFPIVALTANALAGQAEMFLSNGFDDFISKPIDIRQLNNVLNKMIRDRQTPEVLDEARRQKNNLYAAGDHNIAIDPQLAEFFVRDAKKAINILTAIYDNNGRRSDDISTFIINVHAMKSALANVGESELSNKAAELEQAGRDQNINLILSSLPDFMESLNQVIEKLKAPEVDEADEDESNAINAEDQAYLQEKLMAIQAACASFDKKTAKEALAAIKQKSWAKVTRDQLSAIAEHLLHSEFDEAAAIAREVYFT